MITREEALQCVAYCVDNALSPHAPHEAREQESPRLVGWNRDDYQPLVVAVWSYLSGDPLDENEAAELATDYMLEMRQIQDASVRPDFVL